MTRNTDILNELKTISPAVAEISAVVPYDLPAGYFDNLSEVIMARIIAGGQEENTVVSVAGKSTPFEVPENYFEQLSDSILLKVKQAGQQSVADELQQLSPVLACIHKTNVYTVPEGYFETVAPQVTASLQPQAKLVKLSVRKQWVRLSIAASFVIMMVTGAYLLFNRPAAQLDQYVRLGLKQYNTGEQFDKGLQSISDSDLLSYLQATAQSNDAETIASITGEDALNEPVQQEGQEDELLQNILNELDAMPETNTNTN
jgi:phospholipase C